MVGLSIMIAWAALDLVTHRPQLRMPMAAAGAIALGLPCVIGGAASSAALNAWAKQ